MDSKPKRKTGAKGSGAKSNLQKIREAIFGKKKPVPADDNEEEVPDNESSSDDDMIIQNPKSPKKHYRKNRDRVLQKRIEYYELIKIMSSKRGKIITQRIALRRIRTVSLKRRKIITQRIRTVSLKRRKIITRRIVAVFSKRRRIITRQIRIASQVNVISFLLKLGQKDSNS